MSSIQYENPSISWQGVTISPPISILQTSDTQNMLLVHYFPWQCVTFLQQISIMKTSDTHMLHPVQYHPSSPNIVTVCHIFTANIHNEDICHPYHIAATISATWQSIPFDAPPNSLITSYPLKLCFNQPEKHFVQTHPICSLLSHLRKNA